MTDYGETMSGDDMMSVGASIVWALRRLNEGLKLEGFPIDNIIEQVQGLIEQTGHLGDRCHDYSSRVASLELQIQDSQQQNETMQAEIRAARVERDELLGEVEDNWEKDVLGLRNEAELAAREKTNLTVNLAESKQNLEHMKTEQRALEDSLIKCQLALAEREDMVSALREQLLVLEEQNDAENDNADEETCLTTDSGVDTSDLKKARLNRTMEERFRSDELLRDLETLSRKCHKLEADNEELEARLHALSPDSSAENSPFRPGFTRSRSLQDELSETSFYKTRDSASPGGDADRTPAASSLNYALDETSYMECGDHPEALIGCDLNGTMDSTGLFGPESNRKPSTTVDDGFGTSKSGTRRSSLLTDVVLLCLFLILVDVICYNIFGQHLITIRRVDRRTNLHSAIM